MRFFQRLLRCVLSSALIRAELAVAVSLCAVLGFELACARSEQRELSSRVLRLHVVADSDSAEDQSLKLSVRDRLLQEYSGELGRADSVEAAKSLVAGELENIRAIAMDELSSRGCDAEVRVSLGRESFPQRRYGDAVLPAGEYSALRVVIGSGAGQNWWCVMFPPLCSFAEADPGDVPLGSEWDIATENTPEIRFRLRILEVFENLKAKLGGYSGVKSPLSASETNSQMSSVSPSGSEIIR